MAMIGHPLFQEVAEVRGEETSPWLLVYHQRDPRDAVCPHNSWDTLIPRLLAYKVHFYSVCHLTPIL